MSAKSVKNIYALLVSSVALYLPDKTFRVKLPTIQKKRISAPSDNVVMTLYNAAPEWLKICIGLGAFCGMRRGEISALRYGDIEGNVIHIHADMIQDETGEYHYKNMPKTADSVRDVFAPPELLDLIGSGDPDDFVVDRYTGSITAMFDALRKRIGISGVRFHDLRSYYASTGAVLIPDTYLAQFGGWTRSSAVMKEIYQRQLDDKTAEYADIMTGHFSDLISKNMTQNMT